MIDLKELKKLAEAATFGQREVTPSGERGFYKIRLDSGHEIAKMNDGTDGGSVTRANRDLLEATDPQTILDLLAHIQQQEERIVELGTQLDGLSTICEEAYQVIGVLASDAGRFSEYVVQRALDNTSAQMLVHATMLPFPSAAQSKEQG
jgi:hypothetical protein